MSSIIFPYCSTPDPHNKHINVPLQFPSLCRLQQLAMPSRLTGAGVAVVGITYRGVLVMVGDPAKGGSTVPRGTQMCERGIICKRLRFRFFSVCHSEVFNTYTNIQ